MSPQIRRCVNPSLSNGYFHPPQHHHGHNDANPKSNTVNNPARKQYLGGHDSPERISRAFGTTAERHEAKLGLFTLYEPENSSASVE